MKINQEGFAPIIFLVIIAVVVGGYFLYINYPNNISQLQSQFETFTWKTHIDSQGGFSFRYPPSFKQREGSSVFDGPEDVFLVVMPTSGVYSFEGYLGSYLYKDAQRTPVVVDGVKSYMLTYSEKLYPPGGPSTSIEVETIPEYHFKALIWKNDNIYSIDMSSLSKSALDNNRKNFDLVLSTFKFASQYQVNQEQSVSLAKAKWLVGNLPEVQEYQKKVPKWTIEFSREDKEKNAWIIHVYEAFPKSLVTFNWYSVNKIDGKITKMVNTDSN